MNRTLVRGLALAFGAVVAVACSSGEGETPSQLVLAFNTDMKLPEDVDRVALQIKVNGAVKHAQTYDVGPSGVKMPSTLTLVDEASQTAPVKVRLVALAKSEPKLLRDIVTTVPRHRVAMMRVPINFLCYGAASVPPGQKQTDADPVVDLINSACDANNDMTCVAGSCQTSIIDSANLPPYLEQEIFGGGTILGTDGSCFDVNACFAPAVPLATDGDCTATLPSGLLAENANFGIRMPLGSPGVCDDKACIVALDGQSAAGWVVEGNKVHFPKAVCAERADKIPTEVVVTDVCVAKTESLPTCGPWSSVTSDKAVTPDGGSKLEPPDGGAGEGGVVQSGPFEVAANEQGASGMAVSPNGTLLWTAGPPQTGPNTIRVGAAAKKGATDFYTAQAKSTITDVAASDTDVYFVETDDAFNSALKHCALGTKCTAPNTVTSWGPAFGGAGSRMWVDGKTVRFVFEPAAGAGEELDIWAPGDTGPNPYLLLDAASFEAEAFSAGTFAWVDGNQTDTLKSCAGATCSGGGDIQMPPTLDPTALPVDRIAISAAYGDGKLHAYFNNLNTPGAIWECPLDACVGKKVLSVEIDDMVSNLGGTHTVIAVRGADGTTSLEEIYPPAPPRDNELRRRLISKPAGIVYGYAVGQGHVAYTVCNSDSSACSVFVAPLAAGP